MASVGPRCQCRTTQHLAWPLAFLLALVNEPTADMRLRLNAAVALMPYVHAKAGETGKKDAKQDAAKKASAGKFAPSHAPVRLVT